jgi:hypothetical protein
MSRKIDEVMASSRASQEDESLQEDDPQEE